MPFSSAKNTLSKQDYVLRDISCERIENPRVFAHYVCFSNAKLVFFFQKRCLADEKIHPVEQYYVNNWLFFKQNIFSPAKPNDS